MLISDHQNQSDYPPNYRDAKCKYVFPKTYTLYETPQVHNIFYRSGGQISIMLQELDTQMCVGYIAKER